MSTSYASLEPIRMADLFDGRLESFGVHEHYTKETTPNQRFVTDGLNFLWVYSDEKGLILGFTRRGMNAPQHILGAIAEAFGVNRATIYRSLGLGSFGKGAAGAG